MKLFIFILAMILQSASAFGNLNLGTVNVFGTGCKEGSVDTSIQGDFIKIVFHDYQLDTATKRFDRKSCNLAINITLANNYRARLVDAKVQGFGSLTDNSVGEVNLESFFAGMLGKVESYRFEGPFREGFEFGHNLDHQWTSCNSNSHIIRVNSSASLRGGSGYIRMNTLSSGVEIGFQVEPC